MPRLYSRLSLSERLHKHIIYSDNPEGCWLWNGYIDARGYGIINKNHTVSPVIAHRAMYRVTYGSIPSHIHIEQTCQNKLCLRPEHLVALTDEYRFYTRVDNTSRPHECWPWTGTKHDKHGYGRTSYKKKQVLTHRLAFILAGNDIPPGMLICHHCDNPPCCNPTHLFVGTIQDNNADKIRKGRSPCAIGEKNANHKLTAQHVMLIRSLEGMESTTGLAQRFDITNEQIRNIQRRINWQHLG